MLSKLILVALLLISSCAHKKNHAPVHPLNVSPTEYLKLCNNNIALGCYFYAQHLLSNSKTEEAQSYFEKSCGQNHLPSCTNLGILFHQKQKSNEALSLSKNGCLRGDALGCYNSACFLCLKKDVDQSLVYLNKAYYLGYQDAEWAIKDTDLDCLKKNPQFEAWLLKIKSAKEQQRLSPYHINIDHWGLSFVPPQKLKSNFSHPLEFTHESMSKASIAVTSIDPNELKIIIDANLLNLKNQVSNLKEVEQLDQVHNGLPYFMNHSTYELKDVKWNYIQVVTGGPHHSIYAWGAYPDSMESEMGSQIKLLLFNLIVHPDFKIKPENKIKNPPKGYQFAGISIQNEMIYQKGKGNLTLDGSIPYYTITQNVYDLKQPPLTLSQVLSYFHQILPPFYNSPILLNKEETNYKKGKLIYIKGTIGFPSDLPKTVQFDFYLFQTKDKIYTLKFFGSSHSAHHKKDIDFILKQL